MTRAYCLTCNEQVDVDDDGRCPRGHVVSTEDLGPQPWIGRALSAVGNPPVRTQAGAAGDPGSGDAGPGDSAPSTDEPDELAALLADLDDGGPADLPTEDESPPTDSASELAALAEELALRADSPGIDDELASEDVDDEDVEGDDTLGALDDAISAWDESDDAIVAPSEPVPDDADESLASDDIEEPAAEEPVLEVTADELAAADRIPPPPPADAEPPAMAPPPPPPPSPAPPIEDLFVEDDDAAPDDLPPMEEEPVHDEPVLEEPPADEPSAAPREIDLTNFTASGKRIDTSSAPRKKGGRFGFGR